MNELAIIETITAVEVYSNGKLDPLLDRIEKEVMSFIPVTETAKGRKEIASIAHKVAQSKTRLDELGKQLKSEAQKTVKTVDAERKRMRDRLDQLKEKVREPLTRYEEAEKEREAELARRIEAIRLTVPTHDTDGNPKWSAELKTGLLALRSIVIDDSFLHRVNDAALEKERAIVALESLIVSTERAEAERTELERLRREAEEQKQRERDEAIRREAEEKARKEAEEKAAAERRKAEADRLAAEKAAQDELDRLEKEKRDAENALQREKEEAKRKAEEAEAKRLADIQAEKDRAEKARVEAENKRLADIRAAEEKAEREKQEMIRKQEEKDRAERERKVAEEKRIEQERLAEKKRQENEAHRKVINNNILTILVANGVDATIGKKIISAIVKGQMPNVSINY